jgi:hypothetical protein
MVDGEKNMIDLGQMLEIAIAGWFIIELLRRIALFIWEEIRPGHHSFYGPTHKQYYDYRTYLDKKGH